MPPNSVGQEFRKSLVRMSLLHNFWGSNLEVWKAVSDLTVGGCNHPKVRSLSHLVADDAFRLRPQLELTAKTPTTNSGFCTACWLGSKSKHARKLSTCCITFYHLDWKNHFCSSHKHAQIKDREHQPHFLRGRVLNSHTKHMWDGEYFSCHFGILQVYCDQFCGHSRPQTDNPWEKTEKSSLKTRKIDVTILQLIDLKPTEFTMGEMKVTD